MKASSLTFKTIPPEFRETHLWSKVDTTGMSAADAERVERLMAGITSYLQDGKLSTAAVRAGVSRSSLLAQVNRCLVPLVDGGILGWAGLVRNLRLNPYCRRSALPEGERAGRIGGAGAFDRFLAEHLDIKEALDDAIRKKLGSGKARAASNPVKPIWQLFRRLVEAAIPEKNQYPRNTKSCARRSVERYAKAKIATDACARRVAVGMAAEAAGRVGTGAWSFDLTTAPLDLMCIDAHHADFIGTIQIDGPAGPQWVPIERLWIYAVVDAESRAIHGYTVSYRSQPTAQQIELALDMATKPWKPRELTMPGVRYKEGAGFPMGCIHGFDAFAPAALRMDSAMQSFAKVIVHRVRRRFGCALSWSAVGAWYQNDTVERLFGTLERCGFHRLPTSVGTGPSDPKKTNGAAEAVRMKVTWEELLDIVDIAMANHNATAQPGLGYRSPLEVLQAWYDRDRPRYVPRALMPPTMLTPHLGISVQTCTVRGACASGRLRRLYVQVDKEPYTSVELAKRFDLLNKPVIVHVNEVDMREFEIFEPNGVSLGKVSVMKKGWRRTKHSRDLRRAINAMRDAREIADDADDYVAAYMQQLAAKALADARNRPKNISEAATRLAEVARATGASVPKAGASRPKPESATPLRPIPPHLNLRKPWG